MPDARQPMEPTLTELLAEPIIRQAMQRSGTEPEMIRQLIEDVRRKLRAKYRAGTGDPSA